MHRIDNETAAPTLPVVAAEGTPGYWRNGSPIGPVASTIMDQDWFNAVQEEIVTPIVETGQTLTKGEYNQLYLAIIAIAQTHGGFLRLDDTGAANAVKVTPAPVPGALSDGLPLLVRIAADNTSASTIEVEPFDPVAIVNPDGTPLSGGQLNGGGWALLAYDSVNDYFQLLSQVGPSLAPGGGDGGGSGSIPWADDTGTANHIIADLSPAPGSLASVQHLVINISVGNANTGAVDLALNGLTTTAVQNLDGSPLVAGQMAAGDNLFVYDGTAFVLLTTAGPLFWQKGKINYAAAAGTANAITVTLAPVPASIAAGFPICFKASADNTGATTISPNGLGPYDIISAAGAALVGGEFVAGGMYELRYNGTEFQITSVPTSMAAAASGIGRLVKRTFITTAGVLPGGFTPQVGVTKIRVRGQGGGGAGAGTSTGNASGGGASGSYAEAMWSVSSISAPVTVTVGAGGAGNSNASGSAGGTTSFGTYLTAPGGGGGSRASGMPSAGGAGGVPGSVGSVSGSPIPGTAMVARGNAGGIGTTGPGTTGTAGGNGGAGMFGGGAASVPGAGVAGTAGFSPGAGGSGATYDGNNANSVAGGAGAAGWIEIEEYAP